MDWVQALQKYIEDNGLGTRGVTLFEGDLPDDGRDDACTALNEYNGRTDDTMGAAPLAVDIPGLQVSVRAKSYAEAKERIKAIRALLLSVRPGGTINGQRFIAIRPNGTLHDLKRDSLGRQQFTTNLEVSV